MYIINTSIKSFKEQQCWRLQLSPRPWKSTLFTYILLKHFFRSYTLQQAELQRFNFWTEWLLQSWQPTCSHSAFQALIDWYFLGWYVVILSGQIYENKPANVIPLPTDFNDFLLFLEQSPKSLTRLQGLAISGSFDKLSSYPPQGSSSSLQG